MATGVLDNSGLTIHYTPTMRNNSASITSVGASMSEFHLIPAGSKEWMTSSTCASVCLESAMDDAGIEELYIFAVLLHSNSAGRKMRLRHIR